MKKNSFKINLLNPAMLESLIDSTNDTIWDLDLLTSNYFVKFRDEEIYGHLANDEISDRLIWENLLHPDDKEKVMSYLHDFIKGNSGDFYRNIYRIKISDKNFRWILSRGKARRNSNGDIIRISGSHIDITENYELRKKIESLAYFDQTTDLPNIESAKLYFEKRHNQCDSIFFVYIEIDEYKSLNILWESTVMKNILKKIGDLLTETFDGNFVGVINDGVFLILLETNDRDLSIEMNILKSNFNRFINGENSELNISFTAGISRYKIDGEYFDELIKRAQVAFYSNTNKGSNKYCLFDLNMAEKFKKEVFLTKEIKKAIDNKEFEMYYQPIVNAQNGILSGLEALIRWKHKEKGYISPASFIKVAELSGQMVRLESLILENVFSQVQKWASNIDLPLFISINLSAKGLLEGDLVKTLETLVQKYKISTEKIEFEITETFLIKKFDKVHEVISQVKKMGFKVSLDDFGIEYSSLNYLKSLPINKLKMDKTFIDQIAINDKDKLLLKHLIELGHKFDLQIVGEGVEKLEQVQVLRDLNCDYIQGYFYGKPMSDTGISDWIKKNYINKVTKVL